MKKTDYTYLVFMYGKPYVDNVLRYCERAEDETIHSPERYLESMTKIVDLYNSYYGTDLKVHVKPPAEHIVYEDGQGGYYHIEKKKEK